MKSFLTKFSAPLSASMVDFESSVAWFLDEFFLDADTRVQTAVQIGRAPRERPRTA